MLVGTAVLVYTYVILTQRPESKIWVFYYIGGIVLAFGVLREVRTRLAVKKPQPEPVGPPPATRHHAAHPPQTSPYQTHGHVAPQQHYSYPYTPQHKQCPRCHQAVHGHSRFCTTCGHRFF
jgi:hypothetical protein